MKKYLIILFLAVQSIAVAQPRIEVDDLDFGFLGVGQSITMTMKICNIGTDTLTFRGGGAGNDFLEWLRRSEFTVAQSEIARIGAARLVGPDGPGACITIPVTFMSDAEGFFRDSAQLFTSTRNRKDYSIWLAVVTGPHVRLGGYEWGARWVVSPVNHCTRNTETEYAAVVDITNEGTGVADVISVAVVGVDAGAFRLDESDQTIAVRPGDRLDRRDPRRQRVFFAPAMERNYEAQLMLVIRDPLTNQHDTLYSLLTGTGTESHLFTRDYSLGAISVGESRPGSVILKGAGSRRTTITGVKIEGDTADFRLDPAMTLPTPAVPWIVTPGDSQEVRFVFEPVSGGSKRASLVYTGDFDRCGNSTTNLSGNAVSAVMAIDAAYGNRIVGVDRSGTIHLRLARPASLSVEIFDSAGELVLQIDAERGAGDQRIVFDLSPLASGAYHLRVTGEKWSVAHRFVVL